MALKKVILFTSVISCLENRLSHSPYLLTSHILGRAGIQMPEKFDFKGIFSLVTQVLGFTYEIIRAQAVKRLGEKKVSHLEQSFEIFKVLVSQGVGGIWQFVKDQMGDHLSKHGSMAAGVVSFMNFLNVKAILIQHYTLFYSYLLFKSR